MRGLFVCINGGGEGREPQSPLLYIIYLKSYSKFNTKKKNTFFIIIYSICFIYLFQTAAFSMKNYVTIKSIFHKLGIFFKGSFEKGSQHTIFQKT